MMNRVTLRVSLSLLAILLAACAPAATNNAPTQPAEVELSATPSPESVANSTPAVDLTATYMLELLSATPLGDAQPVATSRGPELHATDPTTVSLASGGLQFVEFFRFT
jgi:hypothetical protein